MLLDLSSWVYLNKPNEPRQKCWQNMDAKMTSDVFYDECTHTIKLFGILWVSVVKLIADILVAIYMIGKLYKVPIEMIANGERD
jgi:hypothetical protein